MHVLRVVQVDMLLRQLLYIESNLLRPLVASLQTLMPGAGHAQLTFYHVQLPFIITDVR